MLYHIRCLRYGGRNKDRVLVRTIENAKGHSLVPGTPGLLMVQLENDERIFVNFNNFDFLDFSNGWAKAEAVAAQAAIVAAEAKEKNGKPPPPVITGPGGAS